MMDPVAGLINLSVYEVRDSKSTDDEMHFQVDAPDPIACEECGVQGEFVWFGKRDVPFRDLPIHGKRVTLWVFRRRLYLRDLQDHLQASVTGDGGRLPHDAAAA